MSLNKVMLIGRLTRDPEMRYTPSGQPVTNLSLATNRYSGSGEERREFTDYHDIVVWNLGRRNLAEIVAQYTRKGAQVYIEGRLQTRSWDDQNTGQKRYKTEVVAENIEFLESRAASGGGAPAMAGAPATGPAPAGGSGAPNRPAEAPVRDVDPDEIPF
jgi:single-strand DNA-binding protein